MIKSLGKLTLIAILAAAAAGLPVQAGPAPAPAADSQPATPAKPETKAKAIPFKGKIGAMDKTSKTITLDESTKRVFHITQDTKLERDDKPVAFDAFAVGDGITGSYFKGDDGKLTAKSVYLRAKPGAKGKGKGTDEGSAPATKKE